MNNIYFRKAEEKDIESIKNIYNQTINLGGITADIKQNRLAMSKERNGLIPILMNGIRYLSVSEMKKL